MADTFHPVVTSHKKQKKPDKKPVSHLVVDTGAIIANVNLHTLADHYYIPEDVIRELKSRKAKQVLEQLPFQFTIREPSMAAMKAVIESSKKTGDFPSLSLPDLKIIGLTYDLHQQFARTSKENETEASKPENDEEAKEITEALRSKLETMDLETKSTEENGAVDAETKGEQLPEGFCDEAESDDDEGWITQDNLADALKKIGGFEIEEEVSVACLTTDFALQNVLLHMNLALVSLSGYRIRKLRSFVLRCRACFATTSNMTKEFCPSCGNKMLYKCPVSVDEDGNQVVHINWQRLENKRGLKYSIPPPKGGKHGMNEILFEDQPLPQNRLARSKQNPITDNPFSMHDTTSRSALLGIRTMTQGKKPRNPNESRGNRKK